MILYKKSRLLLFGLLACVVILTGCAMESSHSIPTDMRDAAVLPFENNSSEPGLENLLTDESTQQFLADGRLKIVSAAEADVLIQGVITNYRRIPLIYSEQDIVQQYKIRISINFNLIDQETREVLRSFRGIYRETTYSDQIAPIESEYDAQQRVIYQLARDVVSGTVEGWPYLKT